MLSPSLRSVKVWVKRDNGQYWPSIIQSFEGIYRNYFYLHKLLFLVILFLIIASCSALEYGPDTDGHYVFVGLSNGQIHVSGERERVIIIFSKNIFVYCNNICMYCYCCMRIVSLKIIIPYLEGKPPLEPTRKGQVY